MKLPVIFLCRGSSICSGDYHPDAVLRQEQRNKANKVAYYSELHEYHTKYASYIVIYDIFFFLFLPLLFLVIFFFVWQNDTQSAIVEGKMDDKHESRKFYAKNTKVNYSFETLNTLNFIFHLLMSV